MSFFKKSLRKKKIKPIIFLKNVCLFYWNSPINGAITTSVRVVLLTTCSLTAHAACLSFGPVWGELQHRHIHNPIRAQHWVCLMPALFPDLQLLHPVGWLFYNCSKKLYFRLAVWARPFLTRPSCYIPWDGYFTTVQKFATKNIFPRKNKEKK